jgi:hypothetical protein
MYGDQEPTGIHTVEIEHIGCDGTERLPEIIEIHASETTRVDMEMDTGIR